MKEHPIIFSAPMVRAILAGIKNQTRRIMKPQPPEWCQRWGYTCFTPVGAISARGTYEGDSSAEKFFKIPYGTGPTPKRKECGGDRLWVRETWNLFDPDADPDIKDRLGPRAPYQGISGTRPIFWTACYRADGELSHPEHGEARWRPSIHMPRWASRITLEITNVRAERLQQITEQDAVMEGVGSVSIHDVPRNATFSRRDDFAHLWDIINGKRANWDSNPYVWVIEFKRVQS